MTMCKNQKLKFLLLVSTLGLLFTGCTKGTEQFIVSSDEEGIICSAKSSFNDTLFYENRFPDTTVYYYTKLTKPQNEELKKIILKLKEEKSIPKFELRPGSFTFALESDGIKCYEGNFSIPTSTTRKLLTFFRNEASVMKPCKKIEHFWSIDGVTPPDNPIP
ncbi:hypothetical protein [Flavobacterium sp. N1994]|uniref:hypothetical protein n=1 Tax=Flavobacterium sp. N1994 TaxID=2986827 RepID=UPI002223322F|nr:hypothetical protein [Flavobacterium sp. N1994]